MYSLKTGQVWKNYRTDSPESMKAYVQEYFYPTQGNGWDIKRHLYQELTMADLQEHMEHLAYCRDYLLKFHKSEYKKLQKKLRQGQVQLAYYIRVRAFREMERQINTMALQGDFTQFTAGLILEKINWLDEQLA